MIDENNYIPFEDYSRRPDDVTQEDLDKTEQKDAVVSHLPRKTFIPEIDKLEIEAPTTEFINYLSVLTLTAEDNLFLYTAHRSKDPDAADYCLTKAMTLLSLANPIAKKYLDLSE